MKLAPAAQYVAAPERIAIVISNTCLRSYSFVKLYGKRRHNCLLKGGYMESVGIISCYAAESLVGCNRKPIYLRLGLSQIRLVK